MTYRWNFRGSLAFIADVAAEIFVPKGQVYIAEVQPGRIGGEPNPFADNSRDYGSRAAGFEGLVNSTGRYFSAPVAPGAYKVDLCVGAPFGNLRSAINVFDGYCGDTQNRNFSVWQAGAPFGPGAYCIYGPNLYERVSGSTAGSTPPTHTSGQVSDGSVLWK